ncbi:MAG: aminotransferase class V-fold PLP-dependent enzyme [Gammaproteobacteria bacterium]|nr:aminotransferase class V-fold PLP-dependent enzyme [Gammaproteobacteria bacterium]
MNTIADRARAHFPVFATRTYLNSCSYGALCLEVKAAIEEYMQSRLTRGSDWDLWVEQLERARALLARLLRCDPGDVSVSSSVSESLNSLVSALEFRDGRDTIVVTDFDFPTTSQIWLAQERRGARVLRAGADDSGVHIPLEVFDRLIDDRTLLLSIPYVCYRNGVRLDPRPVIELARRRGALVLLDAYQAVGTFPIDVRELGVDFLVGGCLKYLIGTAGVGFMYLRDAERSALQPLATGWFAQENIGAMDVYHCRPARSARRFESGTPNVCGLYAVSAGLNYILDIGLEAIEAQIHTLTGALARRVREHGWQLVTPEDPGRHGGMMAIKSTDAPRLVQRMSEAGIVVSDRDGNLRVSLHFYNNESDLDRLFTALEENADLLARA